MLKEKYSEAEQMAMILQGSDFATYCANEDIKQYAKYKSGDTSELSEEASINMRILSMLEGLGYPMGELGTYLYKELIAYLQNHLSDITGDRKDVEKCRALLTELNDAFSSIYHIVAREYLEVGVIPFHLYIERAIDKIDNSSIDLDLSYEIFGANPEPQSYGLQAFQLATYILGFNAKKEVQPPVVKKLTNTPRDVGLK